MTNMSNTGMNLAQFERLLEVYGSDRTRWPAEARTGAAQLVGRDATARQLLAEAEALDRVLDRAPLPPLAREPVLAERIVAAALRSPRMVKLDDAPSGAAPRAASPVGLEADAASAAGARTALSSFGRAAGLLAASLTIGVFLGLSNVPQRLVPALEEVTGATLGNAAVIAQIDPFDEELL